MTKPYPQEFRDDVVRVARNREPGVTIEQIAKDFGVHPMTLTKWMRRARPVTDRGGADPRAEEAQPAPRAGERGAAACGGVSVAGEPAVKRFYPLVTELAAAGIPVTVTCRVLKLSRQPYCRWLADPVTPNEVVEAYRANALFDAHKDSPEFGHRLLADEARDVGEPMADRTAWRITSSNGWWSVFGKKRAKNGKKPGPPAHDDLCAVVDEHGRTRHVFTATRVNELWLVGITEHGTAEGKLYCCAIKDAFSRRIVGYSIDSRMKSRLAVQALENAVQMRGDVVGCVVHSDRGSQFRSRKFLRALAGHDMVGSMGRVGSSGDNAAMESFFSLLQKNVLDRRSWITREQLRIAIVTWIERTYHHRRRQARLGRLTPIEFEAIMTKDVALAA
ncbi:IS3 family transposase [Corynebacterium kalidii]